ncbi:MAG TPA: hypothetical protein VNV82_24150 [Bryobacteraceae bacterium]|jgi:hypothetical protein|nr:hypothetical protein [Bryobacteraceae bacterium]
MKNLVALLLFGCFAHLARTETPDAFDRLRSLAGEWHADLPGFGTMTALIRLVSNGKAIEENLGTTSDNETSIYTRDGAKLLVTHFCALTPDGHVARLAAGPLTGSQKQIKFTFAGASNLHSPNDPHMRQLVIEFTDADHFTEKWTKTEAGKDTTFEMHFHR